jgi:hypothetical protein
LQTLRNNSSKSKRSPTASVSRRRRHQTSRVLELRYCSGGQALHSETATVEARGAPGLK